MTIYNKKLVNRAIFLLVFLFVVVAPAVGMAQSALPALEYNAELLTVS